MDGWFHWLHCKPAHSRRRLLPQGEKRRQLRQQPPRSLRSTLVEIFRYSAWSTGPSKCNDFSIEHMYYELLSIGGCGVDPCRRFINQELRQKLMPLRNQEVAVTVRYDRNSSRKTAHRLCPRQHLRSDARQP